jgi:hypothetical protein
VQPDPIRTYDLGCRGAPFTSDTPFGFHVSISINHGARPWKWLRLIGDSPVPFMTDPDGRWAQANPRATLFFIPGPNPDQNATYEFDADGRLRALKIGYRDRSSHFPTICTVR